MTRKVQGKGLDIALLRRILSYAKPYRTNIWTAGSLTLLLGLIAPFRPWLIKLTLDDYIITPRPDMLLNMILLIITALVLESFLQYWQTWSTNLLGQSVIKDIRMDVFNKIMSFRLGKFDNTPIGQLVTRVVSDVETIADLFSQGILSIIGDLFKLVLIVGVMLFTDWKLTLISLSSIPLLLLATMLFKNAVKNAFREVRDKVSTLNAFVQEHITGMRIVQIFNREQIELDLFKKINAGHRDAHIMSVMAYSIFFPVVEILSALSIALLLWWGSKGALENTVTFGNIVAFILYIYMMFRPIRELANRFNILQMGMIGAARIFRVLNTDNLIENTGNKTFSHVKKNIRFSHVWFAYNNEQWVLKDITFKAEIGQKLAFVGATGAGKTSIINLLGRYYNYQKGIISIDGNDIKDYDLFSLRSKMAYVLQDVFLFSDTIFNNITLRNPAISIDDVEKAVLSVGADKFINKLPGTYHFNVKERGLTLSVGQRQLISFIRAYVYNPEILVLDEATSSIDPETEELIQNATEKLTQNRTSFIIAHRLATVRNADLIFVIDQGRIVESGSHDYLYQKGGIYKKLCQIQFTKATLG